MSVILIACVDSEYGIGKNGGMPWGVLYNDLRFFKNTTLHNTCIAGYKTYKMLHKLSNRDWRLYDPEKPINSYTDKDVYIVGGESVYNPTIDIADIIYLTQIRDKAYGCDRFFPKFDKTKYEEKLLLGNNKENGIYYDIWRYTRIT